VFPRSSQLPLQVHRFGHSTEHVAHAARHAGSGIGYIVCDSDSRCGISKPGTAHAVLFASVQKSLEISHHKCTIHPPCHMMLFNVSGTEVR
jgi:hypothetical protein